MTEKSPKNVGKWFNRRSERMQQLGGEGTPRHRNIIEIPKMEIVTTYKCLQAERTYAAIGWGGHTTSSSSYSTGVSVLLRKRRTVRQTTMAKYDSNANGNGNDNGNGNGKIRWQWQ